MTATTPDGMQAVRPPILAVCFDLDGTLLRDDRMGGIIEAVIALLVARHPWLSADALRRANDRHWQATWRAAEVSWCRGELSLTAVSTRIWEATLADFGVVDAPAVVDACLLQERLECASWRLYDESSGVMAALRERGVRLALITNGPSDLQRAKLEAVGLTDAFETVVVSGDRGVEKPRAEIFQVALEGLGVDAERALHVGDSRSADVAGARAAGMTAVWLDRSGTPGFRPDDVGADAIVTDLGGLLPLVER
jgi:putative hydrolase of the HAD superfamily